MLPSTQLVNLVNPLVKLLVASRMVAWYNPTIGVCPMSDPAAPRIAMTRLDRLKLTVLRELGVLRLLAWVTSRLAR